MLSACLSHLFRPETCLHLAYMSTVEKEHTQSGLSNTSSDCVWKFSVKKHFVVWKFSSVLASCFLKLGSKRFLIYSDTHAGDFKCTI